MSQTDDSIAVVRKAYDCFGKHDLSGLLQLVGEECDWNAPGPANEIPWAGTYHGREDVRRFFDTLDDNIEFLEFSPDIFIGQDQIVVVTGHERDRVKKTGKEYRLDWAHCFEVKNGQITKFQDYQDTAAIQAAMH